jgi:hypothetical protein
MGVDLLQIVMNYRYIQYDRMFLTCMMTSQWRVRVVRIVDF